MSLEPLAASGPRPDDALPLAGSRTVWFREVLRDGTVVPARVLSEAERQRLTGLRAPVAGLSLDRPRLMGVLNVTPDSFSDGGDLATLEAIVARARTMAEDDACDILDVGGESTRPGAAEVDLPEEIGRVVSAIHAIRGAGIATPISVDTRKARVAAAALEAGADMVNDVSALTFDPDMARVVAEAGVPVCLMHAKGDPATMQADPHYDDVVAEVGAYLKSRIEAAALAGVSTDNLVVDPGIGFGKNLQHNLSLLHRLAVYHELGAALLLGVSRKRFIGTLGGAPEPKDRLGGSLAVALWGVTRGVQILRVHDVRETRQALRLHEAVSGD